MVKAAMKTMKPMKAMKSKLVLGKLSKEVASRVKGKMAKAAKTKGGRTPVDDEKTIVEARTKELRSMLVVDLKKLALSKGLEKGNKDSLVAGLLALDAKAREAARAQVAKVKEVIKKMKDDLQAKGNDELKELCRAKQLALGGSKPDKVDRLLDAAKKEGEVEKALHILAVSERRAELLAMDEVALQAACHKVGVNPLLKDIMVERLMLHENMAK